ncbi:hypothetical protein J3R83DRAFT_6803 [Lanmaoa asiatica]|nr:hypothetical protein J3R83DRAFT_6803 [Lanmaoa asiatica]
MPPQDSLTLSSLWGLFNTRGVYILGYSWLCGMCRYYVHRTLNLYSLEIHRQPSVALSPTEFSVRRGATPVELSPNFNVILISARQQFGALQHRTFPVYFTISLYIASALLVLWVFHHPNVLTRLDNPLIVDVAQVYALASVIWFQGVNQFVVGPMTSKYVFCIVNASMVHLKAQHSIPRTMLQRHKLEKVEGNTHDKTTVVQTLT